MNKNDFVKKHELFLKKRKRFNWSFSSTFIVILLLNAYCIDYLPESFEVWYLIAFLAFIICSVTFTLWVDKNNINNSGLVCLSCKSPLAGMEGSLAIESDKCPKCDEKPFEN